MEQRYKVCLTVMTYNTWLVPEKLSHMMQDQGSVKTKIKQIQKEGA